ncbi:MAG: enoyl-[acyl-carrier-protein] reductase FabL [Anaerolineales bacterium]|nr:enoyl-[acyl-carrier-protein] reductase FabL [Anaerolineales bacterium]
MTQKPFENKIVLVTGSGRGIGRGIALHFAHQGADVIVNFFRNRKPAEDTAAEIEKLGRRALVVKANVGDVEAIKELFQQVEETFGGLDIFISNAASGFNRPVMEQKVKGWDWTMDINARAYLFAAQEAVRLMEPRGAGQIVAITSPGGDRVMPEYVVVGASKAALNALTRYMAVELAEKNIRVNAVSPGVVATDVIQHFDILSEEGVLDKIAAATPTGRLVTPQDVAGVVAFLCSPAAEMICGQVITVDGGLTLPLKTLNL